MEKITYAPARVLSLCLLATFYVVLLAIVYIYVYINVMYVRNVQFVCWRNVSRLERIDESFRPAIALSCGTRYRSQGERDIIINMFCFLFENTLEREPTIHTTSSLGLSWPCRSYPFSSKKVPLINRENKIPPVSTLRFFNFSLSLALVDKVSKHFEQMWFACWNDSDRHRHRRCRLLCFISHINYLLSRR